MKEALYPKLIRLYHESTSPPITWSTGFVNLAMLMGTLSRIHHFGNVMGTSRVALGACSLREQDGNQCILVYKFGASKFQRKGKKEEHQHNKPT